MATTPPPTQTATINGATGSTVTEQSVDLSTSVNLLKGVKWASTDVVFQNKIVALIKEADGKRVKAENLLALAANVLGRVAAAQDPKVMSDDRANAIIKSNFLAGNMQARAEAAEALRKQIAPKVGAAIPPPTPLQVQMMLGIKAVPTYGVSPPPGVSG